MSKSITTDADVNELHDVQSYTKHCLNGHFEEQMSSHSPVTCLFTQISIQTLTVISRVIAVYSIIVQINDGTLHVHLSTVVHAEPKNAEYTVMPYKDRQTRYLHIIDTLLIHSYMSTLICIYSIHVSAPMYTDISMRAT